MARLSQATLAPLNKTFEERSPQDLLRWARQIFGHRLTAISAMQQSGSVICHMISTLNLGIPITFVDTGVMFAETLATRDRIRDEYGLSIRTLKPRQTMEQQTAEFGVLYLSVEGQKQ